MHASAVQSHAVQSHAVQKHAVQKHDRLIQRGLTVTLLALAATLVGAALVLYV